MEMTCDWRLFQSFFYPHRRAGVSAALKPEGASTSPAYLVVDGEKIVCAFSEGEDLSDWIGLQKSDIQAQVRHRDLIAYERSEVDALSRSTLALPRFLDQVEAIRAQAKPVLVSSTSAAPLLKPKTHFLLETLKGPWSRFLPGAFGVYIRLSGRTEQSLLLIVRRGSFEAFHDPDLSGLEVDRRKQLNDAVAFLSTRYFMPIQGVSAAQGEWEEWSKSSTPWKSIQASMKSGRAKLTPLSLGVKILLASKASIF
jgi:hypothetical protein